MDKNLTQFQKKIFKIFIHKMLYKLILLQNYNKFINTLLLSTNFYIIM